MSIYKKWALRESPIIIRILAALAAGSIFVCFIPLFPTFSGPGLDCSKLNLGILNAVMGITAILIGSFFALWPNVSHM